MLGWQLWCWLIYWVILGGLQAYQYYGRYVNSELRLERLEHSFSEARLNALRMQLDPHFLFNALNTISSHVERDPKLTRRMIEHLGDLLRMSLESKDRQEVPLAEELAFLEHYLEIQKIRFGDQLRVVIDVAPEVKYAAVPSMFIQPLVENAIRHGISRRAAGERCVRAKPLGDRLEIRVMDDGVGLPLGWTLEELRGSGPFDYAATDCGASSQWDEPVCHQESRGGRDGCGSVAAFAAGETRQSERAYA